MTFPACRLVRDLGVTMMFSGKHLRSAARRSLGAAAVVAIGLLASCGGGTTQEVSFRPERVIALGDEASVLTSEGTKYSVNALDASDALACADHPLWTQIVASSYGFVFETCNPGGTGTVKAFTRATPGARVDDLAAQVDAQIAAGGFTSRDLVTVLVGANDVLALYGQFPQRNEA
ncbi:MAG TPA: hypothetical protein VFX50_12885, partial [Gemmatimonadales bacterium]|nr:hypothetical protein [Gemmatimonadales bacterium]